MHGSTTGNTEAIERYQKQSLRLYQVVDKRLSKSVYIASDHYSIADIAAFTWLRTWEELALDITPYLHVQRWLERVAARAAVQAGLLASQPPLNASTEDATSTGG